MLVIIILLIIFASGIGEKSGFIDALAYYFALTEDVWKTGFGIARFKKQEGKPRKRYPLQSDSYAHASWRGAFL